MFIWYSSQSLEMSAEFLKFDLVLKLVNCEIATKDIEFELYEHELDSELRRITAHLVDSSWPSHT